MFRLISYFIFLLVILFSRVQGADDVRTNAKNDLTKVAESFNKYIDLAIKIKYKVFEDSVSNVTIDTKSGLIYKHRNLQYVEIMDYQMLLTDEFLITIDSIEKNIILSKPIVFDEKAIGLVHFENILSNCSKVKYSENAVDGGHYSLTINSNVLSDYSRIDVYFDKKTYLAKRIILFYKMQVELNPEDPNSKISRPRVEINFESINTTPKFSMAIFSEKKFIKREGQHIVPAEVYSDYQIINQKTLGK